MKNIDKRLFRISLIVIVMMIIITENLHSSENFLYGLINGIRRAQIIFEDDGAIWISILTGVLIYLISSKKR